jgi:P2 family phage contractile tail tube protein
MAVRKIPGKVKELNIFIDGLGFLGTVEDCKLPQVKTKKEVVNGVVIDVGIVEDLVFEGTLNIANAEIYKRATNKSVVVNGKASYLEDNADKKLNTSMGGFLEAEMDTLKAGDNMKTKIKMMLNTYVMSMDSDEVYNIDLPNMIAKIGGKDIYETVRSAVM